jgi:hypothetical protein
MKRQFSDKTQKLADNARLLRAWKKFHRDECTTALVGPYGAVLGELFRMFANLQHVQPSQLAGYIRAIDWSEIDYPTRLVVLHEVNSAITKLREKSGLEPIDDPLPDQPDNVFRVIKAMFAKFPADAGKSAGASGKTAE